MRIIGACDVTRASSRIARRRILRFAELVVSWGGPRRIHVDALVDALHDAAVASIGVSQRPNRLCAYHQFSMASARLFESVPDGALQMWPGFQMTLPIA